MAMSGAERQRKWMEKNRAIHNLRRRNARKKLPTLGTADGPSSVEVGVARRDVDDGPMTDTSVAQFQTKKVGEFRMLVLPQKAKERSVVPVVKPQVFRNDHGAVISEEAFMELLRRKALAEKNGYELDEYSQT